MPAAPTLQPPGAGLPWWELFAAKHFVFPAACRKLTWESAGRMFVEEGAKVLAVWDALPPHKLTERVLIRRLPGMEDSSRHWSVAMTVEHLNIVGFGVRRVIDGLRVGHVPLTTPRTQDVKPSGHVPPNDVRSHFERLLTEAATDGPPILPGVGLRAPHPWFGPIDAHRWRCLLAVHQQIHRKQVEAIRAGLAGH